MEVLSEANYAMAKAGCYQCTNPGVGVAFDASIEGEGGLYMCRNCLFDAANLLGWEQDKGLQHALDQALERNLELQEQLEAQDELVKTLNKAYTLYKAREAKSAKRMDAGLGGLAGQPPVGGDVVDREAGQSLLHRALGGDQPAADGPADGPVPGAVQGNAGSAGLPLPRA